MNYDEIYTDTAATRQTFLINIFLLQSGLTEEKRARRLRKARSRFS